MKNKTIVALFALVLLSAIPSAWALIAIGFGNAPVLDKGWPEGTLVLANAKYRLAWWEGPPYGGGEWHFLYRGNTVTFAQTLAAFSEIHAPVLDVVLHQGPHFDNVVLNAKPGLDTRVDWTLTVWDPESWNHLHKIGDLGQQNEMPPPRIDIYIGGGQVDWTKIVVPARIRVTDDRRS